MAVGDGAGDGSSGSTGDEPGQGAPELATDHDRGASLDVGNAAVAGMCGAVVVDPGDEAGDVVVGGPGAQDLVGVGAALAVAAVVVEVGQPGDTARADRAAGVVRGWRWPERRARRRPSRGRAKGAGLAFKVRLVSLCRASWPLPLVSVLRQPQRRCFDYWWRVLIRSMSRVPWNLGGGPVIVRPAVLF